MTFPTIRTLGTLSITLSLIGCLDTALMLDEMPPESEVAEQGSGTAAGGWAGNVTFTAINGGTFSSYLNANVSAGQNRVTTSVSGSGAETVAARRSGNAVSWPSYGSNMVTEWTLVPAGSRTARITARVIRNGEVLARGSGSLSRE